MPKFLCFKFQIFKMMVSDNFNATDFFETEVIPQWEAAKEEETWQITLKVPKKHLLEFLRILEKHKRNLKAEVEAAPARKGLLLAEVIIRNKKNDPLLEIHKINALSAIIIYVTTIEDENEREEYCDYRSPSVPDVNEIC